VSGGVSGNRERTEQLAAEVADELGLERRRWFGGWSLLRDGRQVAMVMDTLYVRVDGRLRDELDATGQSRPFRYRRRDGRDIDVDTYRSVPAAILADPDALCALVAQAPPATRTR
jgi:DNA transformation protein